MKQTHRLRDQRDFLHPSVITDPETSSTIYNGELKVMSAPQGRYDDVPEAPAEYAPSASRTARVRIDRAGIQLAG